MVVDDGVHDATPETVSVQVTDNATAWLRANTAFGAGVVTTVGP